LGRTHLKALDDELSEEMATADRDEDPHAPAATGLRPDTRRGMSDRQPKVRRIRHPWRLGTIGIGVVVGGLLIALASVVPFSSAAAKRKLVEGLAVRLDAEVELADLRLRILPQFRAEGVGLTIRHKGRRDVPPLIAIKRFSAEGNVGGLLRRHVTRVVVEQLDIEIPPDRNRDGLPPDAHDTHAASGRGSYDIARTFVVDELVSNEGQLVIIPRDDKHPKVWAIHQLRMANVSVDRPMPFVAALENAVPPGNIEASGSFGPWVAEDPGRTLLDGKFTFERADLGVFKGISGILSARGTFGGMLERIDIHGETDTPDFTVAAGGHPMPLHAMYHAIVDGTNGNTLLEQVDASFLDTTVKAKGGVVEKRGVDGRTVMLDVTMDRARLDDVLRMAVKAPQPPMVGALKLKTKFELPPGNRDVVEKLNLDGVFTIADARFTNADVQTRINELSHRTRGQNPDRTARRVSSQFAGTFKLRDGSLAIPHVTFDVPGAAIRLSGTYSLVTEQIDFAGTAFTDAKISEMTTGFKSFLLKPVDLLFNRNHGGSAIPIRISGTRNDPAFALDKGRVLKRQ
jgi:hypothetical protein